MVERGPQVTLSPDDVFAVGIIVIFEGVVKPWLVLALGIFLAAAHFMLIVTSHTCYLVMQSVSFMPR